MRKKNKEPILGKWSYRRTDKGKELNSKDPPAVLGAQKSLCHRCFPEVLAKYFNFYHSWQRVRDPQIFYEKPYIAWPPFRILLPPSSTVFVALLLWLNVWSHQICVILHEIMDLHLLSLGTLVPAVPCCVFYTRHQVYQRFDRDDMVFASTAIWYHPQRQIGTNRLVHIYKYILTPPNTIMFERKI